MDEKQPCHIKLRIPSDAQATAARTFSVSTFNRILANWASDLFQIMQIEKEIVPLPIREHSHRMAA